MVSVSLKMHRKPKRTKRFERTERYEQKCCMSNLVHGIKETYNDHTHFLVHLSITGIQAFLFSFVAFTGSHFDGLNAEFEHIQRSDFAPLYFVLLK